MKCNASWNTLTYSISVDFRYQFYTTANASVHIHSANDHVTSAAPCKRRQLLWGHCPPGAKAPCQSQACIRPGGNLSKLPGVLCDVHSKRSRQANSHSLSGVLEGLGRHRHPCSMLCRHGAIMHPEYSSSTPNLPQRS